MTKEPADYSDFIWATPWGRDWISDVVALLPDDVLAEIKLRCLIACDDWSDGFHLSPLATKGRDVVFIPSRLMPQGGGTPFTPEQQQHFKTCLFHEIAHAYLRHIPPDADPDPVARKRKNEAEAEELTDRWMDHCKE